MDITNVRIIYIAIAIKLLCFQVHRNPKTIQTRIIIGLFMFVDD